MTVDNPWQTISEALRQAREARTAVDLHAQRMADLIVPSLRSVDKHTLARLKRELQLFDAKTLKWRPTR